MEIAPGITVDPDIAHGAAVIAGLGIPVSIIVGSLGSGLTAEEVMREYDVSQGGIASAHTALTAQCRLPLPASPQRGRCYLPRLPRLPRKTGVLLLLSLERVLHPPYRAFRAFRAISSYYREDSGGDLLERNIRIWRRRANLQFLDFALGRPLQACSSRA